MISKLALLPVMVFFIFQGTFIGVYIMALASSHVEPFIPVISATASTPPESCIFSQMMNIGAVLMACTIYIRYRHVIEVAYRRDVLFGLERLNFISLIIGLISTLGASIVANFQISNVFTIHAIGAILCFACGTAYFGTQTALTYYLQPFMGSMLMAHLRAILSLFSSLLFVIMSLCDTYASIIYDGQSRYKWHPADAGYQFHIASTISEWLISMLFSVFMLSFAREFSEIEIDHPKLTILTDNYNEYIDFQPSSDDDYDSRLMVADPTYIDPTFVH